MANKVEKEVEGVFAFFKRHKTFTKALLIGAAVVGILIVGAVAC